MEATLQIAERKQDKDLGNLTFSLCFLLVGNI